MKIFGPVAWSMLILSAAGCSSTPNDATGADGEPVGPPPQEVSVDRDDDVRVFEYRGSTVWTRLSGETLPFQADTAEFSATVLDDGGGPMLCLAIEDSFPPQCSGPVIEGLEMNGDWVQSANGVRWGERNVTVGWPPVDDRLEHIDDRPIEQMPRISDPDDRFALPEMCSDIADFTSIEVLQKWAEANPDRAGEPWIAEGRYPVLPVVGDVDEVRDALATDGFEPCLVPTGHTAAELRAAAEEIRPLFGSGTVLSSGVLEDTVEVTVLVADLKTVDEVLDTVDDPTMFRIVGSGRIVLSGGAG